MATVTRVTHKSWFQKIFESFIGVLFGLVMFFGSFVLLWVNEGRTDMGAVARESVAVSAAAVDPSAEGKLVAVTGPLVASEQVGDAPYLRPGPYIALERNVEMFAWVERTETETRDNLGGSSTSTTTYSYEKQWTASPADSSSFEVPQGHTNPELTIEERRATVAQANIGAYRVAPEDLSIGGWSDLALRPEIVAPDAGRVQDGYIFIGRGTLQSPQVGDVRISYRAVAAGQQMTLLGQQSGDAVTPYTHRDGAELFRALPGTREQAIEALHTEYVVWGWVLRVIGFVLMWLGLALIFGPLSAFLDVVPLLGNLSGSAIGAVTFVLALILTFITVVIAIIAHNIFLLIAVLALLLGGVWLWGQRNRKVAAA